jgi:hypothetical protein
MSNNLDKQASRTGTEVSKSNLKPNISEASSSLPSTPSVDQLKPPSDGGVAEKQQKSPSGNQSENGANHSQTNGEEAGKKNSVGNGNNTGKMNGSLISTNGTVQSHNGGLFVIIFCSIQLLVVLSYFCRFTYGRNE